MTKLLTATQAAGRLGVKPNRIFKMTHQKCPKCDGACMITSNDGNSLAGCPRCRSTGSKLPYLNMASDGAKRLRPLIYDWALDIPDVAHRVVGGAPVLPPGLRIVKENQNSYIINDGDSIIGYIDKLYARRWVWMADGTIGGKTFRSRKAAVSALLNHCGFE